MNLLWCMIPRCTLYEIKPVIDFPLALGGMIVGRLSVCFSSPSLSTGYFHVVNGGIDSGSVLFVLSPVYHLKRKQEGKLEQVWLHSMKSQAMWSIAPTSHVVFWGMFVTQTQLWVDLNSTLLPWVTLSKYIYFLPLVLHNLKYCMLLFHSGAGGRAIGGCDYF